MSRRVDERARIRAAVIEVVVERGYEATTLELVLERAGVSRAAFHRHYSDLHDCCLRIYLANIEEFDRLVLGDLDPEADWRTRLRATAYASLRYFGDRPTEARFNVVAMLASGDAPALHRDRYVQRIIDLIDEGRQELPDPGSRSRAVAAGVFGAVFEFLLREVSEGGDLASIDRFVPELMYMAVRPYLGHEVALEELSIPPPPRPGRDSQCS